MAVKKVRFDSFQPESVKFMAREIRILRRLDHANVMKLEGIITSKLSSHIYLVFEYMEHDLAGLVSCPEIKFTDSQVSSSPLLCRLLVPDFNLIIWFFLEIDQMLHEATLEWIGALSLTGHIASRYQDIKHTSKQSRGAKNCGFWPCEFL